MTTEQQECFIPTASKTTLLKLNDTIEKKDYTTYIDLFWNNSVDTNNGHKTFYAATKLLAGLLQSLIKENFKRDQPKELAEMPIYFKKYSYGPVLIVDDRKNNYMYEFCYDNKDAKTSEKKLVSSYKVWRVIRDNDGSESCELVMQRNDSWKNIKKAFFENTLGC